MFWNQNFKLSECLVSDYPSTEDSDSCNIKVEAKELSDDLTNAFRDFLDQVADGSLVEIYSPARSEVILGSAVRAVRSVLTLLDNPNLWTGEHSAGCLRLLAETEIYFQWMRKQDGDVFERFQRFGRGKRKLMKRNLEELNEIVGGNDDLQEIIEDLTTKTGGDYGEQFQEVDLNSTFSGVTVREMAKQSGLEELYRSVYQTTSGITHGEWWALEDYVIQRCENPLHLFHQIPSLELKNPIQEQLGQHLVGRTVQLFAIAGTILEERPGETPRPK